MKVTLLCGGYGTRLTEETVNIPKPMVEIGSLPIILHIMKIYASYGFKDFVLTLGYKSEKIKEYFLNYHAIASDLKVSLSNGKVESSNSFAEDFTVEMVDTGLHTMTGGRVKRLERILRPCGTFMLTYGDGVADVNIQELIKFHKGHGKLATVTAVRPSARFGRLVIENDQVLNFKEKQQTEAGWVNGGFFVFEPEVFDYIEGDQTNLESEPLEKLSKDGQLMAYKHYGFWQCMDTLRDKKYLEELWEAGHASWATWLDQQ